MAFPYHKQETNYTCGAASMRMALESAGVTLTEKQVAKMLGTNKVRGTWTKDIPRISERFRLNYSVRRNASINDMKKILKEGYTVIVCYLYPPEKVDHYSVIKRIDGKSIYFWDPWFGPEHKYAIRHFEKIWSSDPRYEKEKRWFCAIRR